MAAGFDHGTSTTISTSTVFRDEIIFHKGMKGISCCTMH